MNLLRPINQRGQQTFVSILSRSRVQIANLPSTILLGSCIALGISGCGQSSSGSSGSGSPPQLQVASATDLGTLPTNPDIIGRDEAYSAKFQGYSVWLYGDTALAKPDASSRTFLSNTWSYTTDLDATNGIAGFQERLDSVGSPSMLIQETPDELSFNLAHYGDSCQAGTSCGERWAVWPSSIMTDPVTNNALVFYTVQLIDSTGTFTGMGSSVAIWQSFNQLPQRPTFNPPTVADHPDLMFNQNEPSFGSATVINNGVLYVYGCGGTRMDWTRVAESQRSIPRLFKIEARGPSISAMASGLLRTAMLWRSSVA
jgi:hypothetical protein